MSASAAPLREVLISVIICTRNRAELLGRAIQSVVDQDVPSDMFEVVVVDNASSDRTPSVARGFQDRIALRYVREEKIGLCMARNTGWRAASGRYVVFFDDDAVARPGWLCAIKGAFERAGPSAGVVGGRVDPIWEVSRPTWLADEIAGSLTIVHWGDDEKVIRDVGLEWLVGANMALPKHLLADIGGFHPWLDRVGSNLLSSGDVFLQKEVVRRGYDCLYVPAIAIEHWVPASRLTQKWFMRRFFWQGVSDAVMQLIERVPSPRQRLSLAAKRMRRVLRSPARLASLPFRTDSPDAFKKKCFTLIDVGYVAGLLGAAKH
jgi:glycosyltransferase involved in cell wall biosynthesis